MKTIFAVTLPTIFIMCVCGLIAIIIYRRQLKRDYPDVHAKLFCSDLQVANDFRFTLFLLSGEYAKVVRGDFKRKSDFLRAYVIVYILVLAVAFVAFSGL